MKRILFKDLRRLAFLLPFVFISACSDGGKSEDAELAALMKDLDLVDAEYPAIYISDTINGCSALTENYCDQLYDSEHKGNADIIVGDKTFKVRFGYNKQGFFHGYTNYEIAKWVAQRKFPSEFLNLLKSQNYFELLKKFLKTKPTNEATAEESLETDILRSETSAIWNWALGEVITLKSNAKIRERGVPSKSIEANILRQKVSKEFNASIFEIIWKSSPEWSNVTAQFEEVQKAFLEVLNDPTLKIDDDLRQKWIGEISSVKLIPPSSDPDLFDEDCGRSMADAKYFPYRHVFTVCGGLVGASDLEGIIAHELAHSLGIKRTSIRYSRASEYSLEMKRLRDQICSPNSSEVCPSAWEPFKKNADRWLNDLLSNWNTPAKDFLTCLQYRKDLETWPPEDKKIDEMASMRARAYVSDLAGRNQFLTMSKSTLTMTDGTESKNPKYLNPCGIENWAEANYQVGDYEDLYFFFSASYRCGDRTKPAAEQLESAIVEARDMFANVLKRRIPLMASFSNDQALLQRGFSEDSEERFADNLGYRILALLLRNDSEEIRRARYLSNISFFCEKPSAMKKYPDELQAEKKHSFEEHSAGLQRRHEIQVKPLRKVLGCDLDFDASDCEL